jgi:hypothetical protein
MYRNDPDLLQFEAPAPRATRARSSDNSAAQVLWEVGLVLAGALTFAAAVNEALTLFHIA